MVSNLKIVPIVLCASLAWAVGFNEGKKIIARWNGSMWAWVTSTWQTRRAAAPRGEGRGWGRTGLFSGNP